MWAMRLTGVERFEQLEVPDLTEADLGDGQVLLRFVTGGLCGSDTPKFLGWYDAHEQVIGDVAAPLHEMVGRVVASRSLTLNIGDVVVGIVPRYRGLAEYCITNDDLVVPVLPGLAPDVAIAAQPLSTVMSAVGRVPTRINDRAVVMGLGPLGLMFCHLLHHRGYHVTGVDRIDRSDVASAFGIDTLVTADAAAWASGLGTDADAGLVVDAVGHNGALIEAAIRAAKPMGHVLAFGLPEELYAFPMRLFFRKHLSMHGGTTFDWLDRLPEAQLYLLEHPELHEVGTTHRFHPWDAEAAFKLHVRPAVGRLKVILSEDVPRQPQA